MVGLPLLVLMLVEVSLLLTERVEVPLVLLDWWFSAQSCVFEALYEQ